MTLTCLGYVVIVVLALMQQHDASCSSSENEQCTDDMRWCDENNMHPLFCAPDGVRAIALVGNPGTGKSTILNGLIGKAHFKSGLSFGKGMTTVLQEAVVGKISVYDTPGLSDAERRREAGEELDKLLQKDMALKLVFVVRLQNGRVLMEDANTIKTVLDAIHVDTNDRFGVIINQLSKGERDRLMSNPGQEKVVQRLLTTDRFTSHWCYVRRQSALQDKKDAVLITPELTPLFSTVRVTRPAKARVEKVDTENTEEKIAELIRRHNRQLIALSILAGLLWIVLL